LNKAPAEVLRIAVDTPADQPTREILARLISGRVEVGDTILISPVNQQACVEAVEPLPEGLRLRFDRNVQPSLNCLISHNDAPPTETDVFLVEFGQALPATLEPGRILDAEFVNGRVSVTLQSFGEPAEAHADHTVVFRAQTMLALDPYANNPPTGQVRLLLDGAEIAAGRISMEGYADQRELVTARATNITRVDHRITDEHRCARFGHQGAVIWLTGLSGSGKSTLAIELEKELFNRNFQVYVLDGDNVRHGLNANLGFSPEDRSENIRRVGEVAALFSRAGFIAISAFISPYRSDRARARAAADGFHEIHVNADLSVCEGRDPKGLYKRARAGEIPDFTGISAPYEAPENADLVVDTGTLSIKESVDLMVAYVEKVSA